MAYNEELESALIGCLNALERAGLDPQSRGGAAALGAMLRASLGGPAHTATRPAGKARPDQSSTKNNGSLSGHDPMNSLSEWCGVSVDRLADAFDFSSGSTDVVLHTSLLPAAKSERQRLLAVLKLGVDRVAFGREEVPARELNALCARYDALDQNLPHNLTTYSNYILRRGSRGAYSYRITQYGVDQAQESVRGLFDAA